MASISIFKPMTDAKDKSQRGDRFGTPEEEGEYLNYFDEKGNRLSAAQWLERVKEKAKKKRQ